MVAEDAVTSAIVTYTTPTATDNVRIGLSVQKQQGAGSGSRFSQGSHTIRYRATDAQGNTRDCTFSITVRGVLLNLIAFIKLFNTFNNQKVNMGKMFISLKMRCLIFFFKIQISFLPI